MPRSGSTTNNLRITHYHSLTNLSLSNIFKAHLRFLTTGFFNFKWVTSAFPLNSKAIKFSKKLATFDFSTNHLVLVFFLAN